MEYFSDNTDITTNDPYSLMIEMKKQFKKFCQSGFCQNTTLHGYNYLCFADSTIYRCIWFILILVMNCVAIYFLGKNTEAYINGGLQYEIETSTASLKVTWFFLNANQRFCNKKIKCKFVWNQHQIKDFAMINDNMKWIMLQCKQHYYSSHQIFRLSAIPA